MTAPLCFVDTETTSLNPNRLAWEVALIRRDASGTREMSFFVEVDLAKADPFSLRVGRFHERHPHGRYLAGLRDDVPTVGQLDCEVVFDFEAAEQVARMTHDAHLVGAVPNFDAEVFDRLLRRHRIIPAWHHRLRCVESLTAGHLGREVGGLDACLDALGLVNEAPHTAMGDARAAMAIWDWVITDAA